MTYIRGFTITQPWQDPSNTRMWTVSSGQWHYRTHWHGKAESPGKDPFLWRHSVIWRWTSWQWHLYTECQNCEYNHVIDGIISAPGGWVYETLYFHHRNFHYKDDLTLLPLWWKFLYLERWSLCWNQAQVFWPLLANLGASLGPVK